MSVSFNLILGTPREDYRERGSRACLHSKLESLSVDTPAWLCSSEWEVEAALQQVQLNRLLFCVPYVTRPPASSTRIADVIAFTRRWNLARKLFAGMDEERNSRYQEFLTRVPAGLRWRLPPKLEGSCFLHFLADGSARLLPPRMPWFLQLFNPFAMVTTWNFIARNVSAAQDLT